jgi:hypothetical protein
VVVEDVLLVDLERLVLVALCVLHGEVVGRLVRVVGEIVVVVAAVAGLDEHAVEREPGLRLLVLPVALVVGQARVELARDEDRVLDPVDLDGETLAQRLALLLLLLEEAAGQRQRRRGARECQKKTAEAHAARQSIPWP